MEDDSAAEDWLKQKYTLFVWLFKFLEWFCPNHLVEEIEGDLTQRYERDVKAYGVRKARRRLAWNTVRFFRPGIILRNSFPYLLINTIMFRNYFTIAVRNVARNKVYSAINIFGLSIGLAACLLIFQFVTFELSYDTFHDRYDRIYRVTNDRFQNGKLIQHGTITYPTVGPTMAKDFPEIEMYTRLMPGWELTVRIEEQTFREDYCHFADEHFLSVFSFALLAGDRVSALNDPYSIVLTESLARKYYGNDFSELIGKELYWGTDTQPYKVTGVCQDIPPNSHIQFDALVSFATLVKHDQAADNSWRWSDFRHYLVLEPGVDYKTLESKFAAFSDQYFQGDKVSGSVEKFYLQPLRQAHLYSDYEYDIAKTASGNAVWAMAIVAVFILLIAWINYINLTTSRALDRAKEVGLRKVMGALKSQLVKQFIFESAMLSVLAFAIAVLIVQAFQSSFNQVINGNLSLWKIASELSASSFLVIAATLLGGIVLSGFYPAFVLSSYQPVTVLKGKFQGSTRGQLMRKGLVIFQFTASAALVTGTLIVSKQLEYMNKADLGMNIHNVMTVRAPVMTQWDSTYIERLENYKHSLTQLNGVLNVATSTRLPGSRLGRGFDFRLSDQASSTHYTLSWFGLDYNFFNTYGISILAGRGFVATDHNAEFEKITSAIINQSATKLLGISRPDDAIGREILTGDQRYRIIGVVSDFHQESLKKQKEPIFFLPLYSTAGPTSIRFNNVPIESLVADVQNVYKQFFPDNPFSYAFMEDSYKSQYNDEKRFAKVILIFTVLGIIISCLGLIALSSYTAVQRTKEIGIRKVLGASLSNIVALLSAGFMRLVLVSIILAFPIAYFFMHDWLTNYPYRIALDWIMFATPALIILIIAATTMSFQIVRTARVNPAKTLKYE